MKTNKGKNTDLIFDDDIPNLYIILAEESKNWSLAVRDFTRYSCIFSQMQFMYIETNIFLFLHIQTNGST